MYNISLIIPLQQQPSSLVLIESFRQILNDYYVLNEPEMGLRRGEERTASGQWLDGGKWMVKVVMNEETEL